MKRCSKCGIEKDESEFSPDKRAKDGLRYNCRQCVVEYSKTPAQKEARKRYLNINRERLNMKTREWHQNNKGRRNAMIQRKRKEDPSFRMRELLRSRVHSVLKGDYKRFRTLSSIGCSVEQLQQHVESQFIDGMTWDNHSVVWHLDHIVPISIFNLENPDTKCNHWTNLRPLSAADNIRKSDLLPDFKTLYRIMFSIIGSK